MGNTSRTYSDPTFGSKKEVTLLNTAALNGTAAAATDQVYTFMAPVIVTDWEVMVTTAGNGTSRNVLLGKSLAGTGAVSLIGTITIGTNTVDTVVDGACTETAFAAGDDVVIQLEGTGATVAVVCPVLQIRETFVVGNENG
jgi:hypothetical protein